MWPHMTNGVMRCVLVQMELQREKTRVVELTNEIKRFNELKKVRRCGLFDVCHVMIM